MATPSVPDLRMEPVTARLQTGRQWPVCGCPRGEHHPVSRRRRARAAWYKRSVSPASGQMGEGHDDDLAPGEPRIGHKPRTPAGLTYGKVLRPHRLGRLPIQHAIRSDTHDRPARSLTSRLCFAKTKHHLPWMASHWRMRLCAVRRDTGPCDRHDRSRGFLERWQPAYAGRTVEVAALAGSGHPAWRAGRRACGWRL